MPTYASAEDVKAAHADGVRVFEELILPDSDFADACLTDVSFYNGEFRGAVFDKAEVSNSRFMGCDLTGASGERTLFTGAEFAASTLRQARLRHATWHEATIFQADLAQADLTNAALDDARFAASNLDGACLDLASLGGTVLQDMDATEFCDAADLRHILPSLIDVRTVMRTYHHPRFKRFMVDWESRTSSRST
jgi:uncharacterized protein YjbI with pentapeptide repeats